jgi:two-component system, chemotaxis family, chemotaxis protein CheY
MPASQKPVLVVEDEPAVLKVITLVLTDAGYRVEAAIDGLDALDKIAQERPGLIILDMRMPVMDGWEFSGQVRARYGRTIPLLMLSAATDAAARASQIEAEAYLEKPFDIDELARLVERHYMGR